MNIQGIGTTQPQADAMGDLLKQLTNANMNLDTKMMKVGVVAKVQGLGENIDVSA